MTIHSVTGHLDASGTLTRIDVRGAASGPRAVDVTIEITGKTLCQSARVSDDDTWTVSFEGHDDDTGGGSLAGFACGGLMAARVAPEGEPTRHAEWVGPLDCRAAERDQEEVQPEQVEASTSHGDGQTPVASRSTTSSAVSSDDRPPRARRQSEVRVAEASDVSIDPSSLVTVMVAQPDRAETAHQPPAPGRVRPRRAAEATSSGDPAESREDRPPPRAAHDEGSDRQDADRDRGLDAKLDDLKAKLDDLTSWATRNREESEERSRQSTAEREGSPDAEASDDERDDPPRRHDDMDDALSDSMDALREQLEDLTARIEKAVPPHEASRGSHDWRPVEQATEKRAQWSEQPSEGSTRRPRAENARDEPPRREDRDPSLVSRVRDRAEDRWRDVSDRVHREDSEAPRHTDARHRDRDRAYRDDERRRAPSDAPRGDRDDDPRRYRDDERRRDDDVRRDDGDARRRERDDSRARGHDRDRGRSDDEDTQNNEDDEAEDEGTPWISGTLLILAEAALLVSMAAAGYPILIAVSAALVVPMAAGFAASHGGRSWALWSMGGVGLGTLVVIALLPIVGFVDLDVYLLATGAAVLILGIGIGTLFFTGGDDS